MRLRWVHERSIISQGPNRRAPLLACQNRDYRLGSARGEARYEADAWEEKIVQFLEGKSRTNVYDLARDAIGMETARIGTHDQRRIGAILAGLGWIPFRSNGKRGYKRPDPPAA
jgi:predicted P-loop ATPase